MEFDIAATKGDTLGNLFQNQVKATHLSAERAMVKTKVVGSRNRLIYFMKVVYEGVSYGMVKASLVPSMLIQSLSSIKAFEVVMCSFGSNMEFNQSCKSQKGPERRYFLLVSEICLSL